MSTHTSPRSISLGRAVGRFLRAPAERRTYRNLLYLLLAFPLGTGYFILLSAGFATGLGLAVVAVGVPLLLVLLALVVLLAGFERLLVRTLLGVEVPVPPARTGGSYRTRTKRLVTDRGTWKAVAYLLSEFVYGSLAFGLLSALVATAASFVAAPLYYGRAPVVAYGPIPARELTLDLMFGWDNLLVGLTTTFRLGSWEVGTLAGSLLVAALGALLLLLSFQLSNALARLWGRYARNMLTAPRHWDRPEW